MKTHFKNRFGEVTFRLVSDVMHVRDIRGADLDSRHMFDIGTAEKIALITDNRGIQICPYKSPNGFRCYVVLHETSATAAVAAIELLSYEGGSPTLEIQAARMWS